MKKTFRILIADDHPLLTAGLKLAVKGWEEFTLVGAASSGEEAVALCETAAPDVVLMDMQLPGISGAEAAAAIKARRPQARVVALTTFDDRETVAAALAAGCDGFLLKVIQPEQLRAALHSILDGISVIDQNAMDALRQREAAPASCGFSEREREILYYVCRGCSNREIAEKLSLQPGTIKNMVSLLLSKTYCVSRADLTRYALAHQLVNPEE